jgi:ribosomal protein S18 acetylase RimI-like enzyme
VLSIREFQPDDRQATIAVWERCDLVVPWNDPLRDIARKMQVGRELFLVGCVAGEVVATVMGGYEGHRGWINYLAVDPDHRRRGYAESLVRELEIRLIAIGCPKVNLQVRASNSAVLAFYEKIGYSQDANVSLGKRLIPDQ